LDRGKIAQFSMAPTRKPWPMKWIVLAMILFIVPYTYLTLHYRKPGRGYEPYEDAKEKTLIARAGFRRVSLPAAQAASPRTGDAAGPFAAISASPGGLPGELRTFLIDPPLIPAAIGAVSAPATFDSSKPYSIRYACAATDLHQVLSGARLYIKGNQAYLITDFDRLTDGLSTRTERGTIEVEIQPGTFDPGKYRLTLIGQTASRTWQIEVR
jgi:hypothetical protein